ncbi:MAG: penicillin-binding protein 2 [Verrucomicrobia bacterium]|jgi:cell division protein FtsI/penicillin-binding protein 2|nr:penicillin-binding protein 2 [Verrucomicrobiota bacterium]
MFERLQSRRLAVLTLALVTGLAGLAYRLVDLQVLRHAELRELASRNVRRDMVQVPRRGDILDRNGNPLATSLTVKTVCADPTLIDPHQARVARVLAPLLDLDEGQLADRLQIRTRVTEDGRVATNRYVVLKRKVTIEQWQEVAAAMRKLDLGWDEAALGSEQQATLRNLRRSAVFADPVEDQLRVYPNQRLAAHVLGFVGMEELDVNGTPVIQIAGKEGMEWSLDQQLSGVAGWRSTEKVKGRELVMGRWENVQPRDGLNAVLTLDSVLQLILESELAEALAKHHPLSACGVIVRPRTGEILAMATLPNFDPSQPGASPADSRRNRMLTDVIEPGSTFKIVVVSGALEDGRVTLGTRFDCEQGAFAYGGRVLHDHDPYGVLTVEEIITKSSNIGAAKVGILLGPDRLLEHIRAFGFGSRTGVPLAGEVAGIVHEVKDWSKVTIAQLPMGHGIAVTRMQMTMAMCAIANRGLMMRPMLVDRLEDAGKSITARYAPQPGRQVIRPETARDMVRALKTVTQEGGTATRAALDHYTVAGKTGTAQKAGPGGYLPGKYVASFIGFFPADQPELCIGIFFDEPHNGYYGGVTAAPVFKRVAERAAAYLALTPDIKPESETPVASGTKGAEAGVRTAYVENR